MSGQEEDVSFEDWLRFIFDHPVTDPKWHWEENAPYLEVPPELTVAHITRAFESPRRFLGGYSDAQLNQALWFLIYPACSSYAFAVLDQRRSPGPSGRGASIPQELVRYALAARESRVA
jgi:hypothetical protein